ncbi:MAG TPA: GNAT family acetyltransferase, partial [Fusibacter sp.]|nr:GNAT family acetyltransferase [Fusibacter sp.]
DVLPDLFEFSRTQMQPRFPILITFINHINPRSFDAHTRKLGLDVIKSFTFNNNQYYELGYDTSKKTSGSTL